MRYIAYRVVLCIEDPDIDPDDAFAAALELDEEALSMALDTDISIDWDRLGVLPDED